MLKRYFKLWIIVFWYNEVCNIKDNCHECLNYTFCPRKWSGALQQTHLWRLIISYFDDYQESVWFLLILKSSTHKTNDASSKLQVMVQTALILKINGPHLFEYVKITHKWLTIRRQGYPSRASDLTRVGYSLAINIWYVTITNEVTGAYNTQYASFLI